MLSHPDRAEAEVELADVDCVQGRLKRRWTDMEHVLGPHRVLVEVERAHVELPVDDIPDQLVCRMGAVGGEEHIAVRTLDVVPASEHGNHARHVAVADVVLPAAGAEATIAVRRENHVRRVDVCAVLAL